LRENNSKGEKNDMADTVKNEAKNSIANDLKTQFGSVNMTDNKEEIKTPVRSFSSGSIYIGLKLSSKFDERTGARTPAVPRLTAKFGNEFLDLPLKGKWWKEFADFANDMAVILEGVDIESVTSSGDAATGKELMAQFRGA
jgi:hypothetical protein